MCYTQEKASGFVESATTKKYKTKTIEWCDNCLGRSATPRAIPRLPSRATIHVTPQPRPRFDSWPAPVRLFHFLPKKRNLIPEGGREGTHIPNLAIPNPGAATISALAPGTSAPAAPPLSRRWCQDRTPRGRCLRQRLEATCHSHSRRCRRRWLCPGREPSPPRSPRTRSPRTSPPRLHPLPGEHDGPTPDPRVVAGFGADRYGAVQGGWDLVIVFD